VTSPLFRGKTREPKSGGPRAEPSSRRDALAPRRWWLVLPVSTQQVRRDSSKRVQHIGIPACVRFRCCL
jgi:hypothetical protein